MLTTNTQLLINRIKNEQQAQKTASTLNYGSLTKPDNTPAQLWKGAISTLYNAEHNINARFIATFSRSDGINMPPLVNFSYNYILEQYYYGNLIANGNIASVTGRDTKAIDEHGFSDGLYELGQNYIKWQISLAFIAPYINKNSINTEIKVQAVSPIKGVLALERII